MANEFKIKKGLIVTGASGGTVVDIQGSQGQLFSVTDDLSGSIFAVSDISGVPILDVNSSGTVNVDGTLNINNKAVIQIGTTYAQATDYLYIGGDDLGGGDAAIYLGNRGDGTGYGWRFYYAGIGSGNNNNLVIRSENLNSPVDAVTFNQDGNSTFAGFISTPSYVYAGGAVRVPYAIASKMPMIVLNGATNYGLFHTEGSPDIFSFDFAGSSKQSFNELGDATFVGQGFSAATSSGDASSTLTTKGYVDGLITGATIYRGAWQAGISATSSAATTASTTLTVTAAILDADGNTPVLVGAVVTGAGITGIVKVASVTSSTVYVLDTAITATATAYIFSPIYGAPDLSGVTETSGYYYICSEAGSATPNGANSEPNTWNVGDWCIYNDVSGTGQWQKIDNSSVLSGAGTGQTVALWEGAGSVTDSDTLGNAPITVSGNNSTFAGAGTFAGTLSAPFVTANDPNGAANGSPQEVARFVNVSSGATSAYMYIGASAGTDWRLGKNIIGTSSNSNFGIAKHSGSVLAMEIDGSNNTTFAGNVALTGDLKVTADAATADIVAQWADSNGNNTATFRTTTPGQIFEIRSQNSGTLKFDSTSSTFTGSVTASNFSSTGTSQFFDTVKIEKAQETNQFDTSSFLRLHPSAVTNASGYTNMFFGTSTANNFGVAIGAVRAGAGDTSSTNDPAFTVRILNDSVIGTEVLRINTAGNSTFAGTVTSPTFLGDLNGTINTATTGATQTAGNNSTLIATTAYADAAAAAGGGNFLPLAGGTMTGTIVGPTAGNSSANPPALEVVASGAGNEQASIAIQQVTSEGDTIIFADYDPYVEYGISTENNTNVIQFTGGSSVGSLGSKTLYNNAGNPRTAYTKFQVALVSGETLIGGDLGVGTTTPTEKLQVDGSTQLGRNGNNTAGDPHKTIISGQGIEDVATGNFYGSYGFLELNANNNYTGSARRIAITNGLDANKFAIIRSDTNMGPMQLGVAGAVPTGAVADFVIDTSGNVGIGTTIPGAKLEVFGTGNSLRLDSAANGSKEILFRNVGTGIATIKTDGDLKLFVEDAGKNILFNTNGGEKMRIEAGGKVGIGTSSPTFGLTVSGGSANTNPATVEAPYIGEELAFKIENSSWTSTNGLIRMVQPAGGYANNSIMTFSTEQGTLTEKMRITQGGNVGIGTTTPLAKLDVQGTQGQLFSVTDNLSGSLFAVADISGVPIFDVNSSGVSYFDGNVGIGTDSPQQKLHIKSTTSGPTGIIIENTNNAQSLDLDFWSNGGSAQGRIRYEEGSGAFAISPNVGDPNAMYINYSNNVGIGMTTPQAKLHIGPLTGGNGTAQERLRLTGDYNGTDSGALLRFTNQHDSGTNPNTGEYNLAGIIGYDYQSDWGGAMGFQTAPSSSGGGNLVTRMVINQFGNVGINTTGPGNRLTIVDAMGTNFSDAILGLKANVAITASTRTAISLATSTVNNYGVTLNGIRQGSGSGEPRFGINMHNNSAGGSEAFTIKSSGNVGINVTEPTNQLHVHTSVDDSYGIRIEGSTNNVAGVWTGLGIGGESSNTKSAILFEDVGLSYARGKLLFCVNNAASQASATSGDAKLTISNDGNVGIRTKTPDQELEVQASVTPVIRITSTDTSIQIGESIGRLEMKSNDSSTGGNNVMGYMDCTATNAGSAYALRFGTGNGGAATTKMSILQNGYLGVLDDTPSYPLDVTGTIRATGDIIAFSDVRVKENIKTIKSSLDKVSKLRGVEFNKIGEDEKSIGVIAQEIEKVIPEVVKTDDEGMKSVAYGNISGLLIEAIKELKAEIDLLKSKPCNCNNCNCNI
jgi:hypothetical protein